MAESSESELSDIDECVSMAYERFTKESFSSKADATEKPPISLSASASCSGPERNKATNSRSCTGDSGDSDVDIVVSSHVPEKTAYSHKQLDASKTSKSKSSQVESSRHPQLSSKLQSSIDTNSLYLPKLMSTELTNFKDTSEKAGGTATEPRPLCQLSRRQLKKQRRLERETTKGRGWYNMPLAEMTEEKKNDLMVIQMRKALDPKRFYKGPDIRGALPKYVQTGTIVETKADFYSSRIPKKKRKTSLVDELLADAEFRRYNKRKYAEIQATQPQHKRSKAFKQMKRLKAKKK